MEEAELIINDLNAKLTSFDYPLHEFRLYVPDTATIREIYERELKDNSNARFPYWAKLWPSSIAMAEYITGSAAIFAGKTVLEVAGGLGLPSLAASSVCREIIFTDVDAKAVMLFTKLIGLNQKTNIKAFTLDWNEIDDDLHADILLLSDVNYDDNSFSPLHSLIHRFLNKGTMVLLSTPMRLIGRSFIEPLLPWVIDQQLKTINYAGSQTFVSILLLQNTLIQSIH